MLALKVHISKSSANTLPIASVLPTMMPEKESSPEAAERRR
jgi:hypothetical protein